MTSGDASCISNGKETYETIDDVPEYELLDKYSQAYEEVNVPQPVKTKQHQSSGAANYDFTKCPAYITVSYSNEDGQEIETSLKHPPSGNSDVDV